MRWTAVAPVTWPRAQGWDAWWSHAVAEELGQASPPLVGWTVAALAGHARVF